MPTARPLTLALVPACQSCHIISRHMLSHLSY